ncbi:MAG: Riboflavin biosynthesis protein RibF [Candidatus Roizmanbacteria bacterium GW2011_GWA2_37_7]|uniref:riboflavin kinase n=1 Tax=Candidatus Roizmanbacteria bacterium GW2011_GWA2_37_7 TaxID=1618481 RepID=A0A0G0KDX7_9BACT|nr:MAG: Riboflavin biosynthesis protein RibF [Candidatus Roizmanbacteria bacterium GW2011_GWA2_37_7]
MKNVKVLFTLSGIVQKHLRRGTKLGYPTANMKVYMNAPDGIFVGYVTLDSTRYQAIIFIGKPLTFDEYDKKAEVYILDFERDIYGTHIDVTVLEKLRDNQKFDSHELLIKQMQKDEIQAREFFSTINK